MQSWIIGLLVLGTFIYIVKEWFAYKKVAVQTESYAKTQALLYLFLGFMVFTGVSSLSSEVSTYLFSLLGLTPPEHFQWKALVAYLVFAVVAVIISRGQSKKSREDNINSDDEDLTPKKNPKADSLTRSLGKKHIFIDTNNKLENLKIALDKNNSLVINGIAGTGKTSLATAFLDNYKNNYDYVGYVEVLGDIKSELYSRLSVFMDLESFATNDQNFDEAIKKLNSLDGKILLVIDDVQQQKRQKDAIETLSSLSSNNIQILFTSRSSLNSITSYTLEKLSTDDALALFGTYCQSSNKRDVEYIIEHVSYHAYFVEHIAKIIKNDDDMQGIIEKMKSDDFSKIVYIDEDKDGQEEQFSHNLHTLFNLQSKEITDAYLLILKQLSALPSIEFNYSKLNTFMEVKEAQLIFLVKKGWLIESKNGYKLHQITKEYIFAYHMPNMAEIEKLFEVIT